MPGQSFLRSRSSKRRLVTKILIPDAGSGFSDCALVVVLTDKLRARPLLVVVVAVEDCDIERDMSWQPGTTYALD